MKVKLIYFIVLVAFIFRFTSFTNFPVGFNADEASFGYDAYSLLKTGRDQWGNFLPLYLKSFGDYKSPLYSYISIPFVAALGLNEYAVRLPNVIVGVLAVYITYLLAKKIFDEKVGLIASLLLAINPWSVMISRGAFEFNLLTLFIPLGLYLFLKKKYFIGSLIFGINLFAYHSSLVVVPLIFAGLIYLSRKNIKKTYLGILVFAIFLIANIYASSGAGGTRISERSITQGALEEGASVRLELIKKGVNPFLAKLEHNRYQVIVQRFVHNYFEYFSPRFLFFNGAGESYYGMLPGVGVIYLFEGLLLIGVFPFFWKEKAKRNTVLLLALWLFVSPLAASLATGVGYSGNRASTMLPILQILAAVGLLGWLKILKGKTAVVLYSILFILGAINVFRFCNVYFSTPSIAVQEQMLVPRLEAAKWLNQESGDKEVFVSRSFSEPQIFIAFATKWDPKVYQEATKNWALETWVDQIPSYSLGNYTFTSTPIASLQGSPGTLIVGKPEDFGTKIEPLKTFNYIGGGDALYIVESDKTLYAKLSTK